MRGRGIVVPVSARTNQQVKNLADLYDLAPLDWADVQRGRCSAAPRPPGTGGPDHHTFWLSTIDTDGRPHMTARRGDLGGRPLLLQRRRRAKIRNIDRDPAARSASPSTATTSR